MSAASFWSFAQSSFEATNAGVPSITQLPALERELAKVRQSGFSQDNEELELGVRCMACGIYDDQGKLVAGLSISAPAGRLDDAWLSQLQATAKQICDTLGFAPAANRP